MAWFGLSHDKEKGFTRYPVNPLNLMGWLMGLEPTTTGITILSFLYLLTLMLVDIFNTNQQVINKLLGK